MGSIPYCPPAPMLAGLVVGSDELCSMMMTRRIARHALGNAEIDTPVGALMVVGKGNRDLRVRRVARLTIDDNDGRECVTDEEGHSHELSTQARQVLTTAALAVLKPDAWTALENELRCAIARGDIKTPYSQKEVMSVCEVQTKLQTIKADADEWCKLCYTCMRLASAQQAAGVSKEEQRGIEKRTEGMLARMQLHAANMKEGLSKELDPSSAHHLFHSLSVSRAASPETAGGAATAAACIEPPAERPTAHANAPVGGAPAHTSLAGTASDPRTLLSAAGFKASDEPPKATDLPHAQATEPHLSGAAAAAAAAAAPAAPALRPIIPTRTNGYVPLSQASAQSLAAASAPSNTPPGTQHNQVPGSPAAPGQQYMQWHPPAERKSPQPEARNAFAMDQAHMAPTTCGPLPTIGNVSQQLLGASIALWGKQDAPAGAGPSTLGTCSDPPSPHYHCQQPHPNPAAAAGAAATLSAAFGSEIAIAGTHQQANAATDGAALAPTPAFERADTRHAPKPAAGGGSGGAGGATDADGALGLDRKRSRSASDSHSSHGMLQPRRADGTSTRHEPGSARSGGAGEGDRRARGGDDGYMRGREEEGRRGREKAEGGERRGRTTATERDPHSDRAPRSRSPPTDRVAKALRGVNDRAVRGDVRTRGEHSRLPLQRASPSRAGADARAARTHAPGGSEPALALIIMAPDSGEWAETVRLSRSDARWKLDAMLDAWIERARACAGREGLPAEQWRAFREYEAAVVKMLLGAEDKRFTLAQANISSCLKVPKVVLQEMRVEATQVVKALSGLIVLQTPPRGTWTVHLRKGWVEACRQAQQAAQ